MKFTLGLLLVVLFVTYKFGESLPARRMMHDYDYDEKTVNRENNHWYILSDRHRFAISNIALEEDIDINRLSSTPKGVAYVNQRKLDGRRKGSGTSLKKMVLNEEDIPINEVTRYLFGMVNPKPKSQPVSEPAEEDGFNKMENKVQNESISVNPIQTNCNQNYISQIMQHINKLFNLDSDGLLLTLWNIIVQLLNYFL